MEASITLKSLAKKYREHVVLADLSLGIESKSTHALIGQNGSGKSIILKILVGLIERDAGTAYINGKDISSRGSETKMITGYMPQYIDLDNEMNIYENLLIFAQLYGLTEAKAKKKILYFSEKFNFKDKLLDYPENLSKGILRTIQFTRALVHDPQILLLDEPTLHMDQKSKIEVWNMLDDLGSEKTILFTTQNFEEVEKYADRLSILHNGDIKMDGTLEKLLGTTRGLSKFSIRFIDPPSIDLIESIQKMPRILKPELKGNSLEFFAHEKKEFFIVLKSVINSEISDIDVGFCRILDLYLGLIGNGLE